MKVKTGIVFFLTIVVIMAIVLSVAAEEPISIVFNAGVAPLQFEDASGRPAGMFPGLWRMWAEKTGREIRFVKTESFSESLDLLKSGAVDLHAGLFKIPEREKFLDYSEPILALIN